VALIRFDFGQFSYSNHIPYLECQVHKTTVNSCHGQSCDKESQYTYL